MRGKSSATDAGDICRCTANYYLAWRCDEHTFEYLDRISTRLHELEDTLEEDRVEHTCSQHMSNIMSDKSERRNHLATLSQRSWFHRTWVVQEVVQRAEGGIHVPMARSRSIKYWYIQR